MGGREKVDRERERDRSPSSVPANDLKAKRVVVFGLERLMMGILMGRQLARRLVAEEKKGERREEDAEQLNRYIFI